MTGGIGRPELCLASAWRVTCGALPVSGLLPYADWYVAPFPLSTSATGPRGWLGCEVRRCPQRCPGTVRRTQPRYTTVAAVGYADCPTRPMPGCIARCPLTRWSWPERGPTHGPTGTASTSSIRLTCTPCLRLTGQPSSAGDRCSLISRPRRPSLRPTNRSSGVRSGLSNPFCGTLPLRGIARPCAALFSRSVHLS